MSCSWAWVDGRHAIHLCTHNLQSTCRNRDGGDKASVTQGLNEPSSCALGSSNRSCRWIRYFALTLSSPALLVSPSCGETRLDPTVRKTSPPTRCRCFAPCHPVLARCRRCGDRVRGLWCRVCSWKEGAHSHDASRQKPSLATLFLPIGSALDLQSSYSHAKCQRLS